MPDLLLTTLLILYLTIIFSKNYSKSISYGIFCGIIGALAFLTKSYALLFFLLHFPIFNLFQWKANISPEKKKKVAKNLLIGLVVFFIISGVWIFAISEKYGKLTYSTSGDYNFKVIGPQKIGQPAQNPGFIQPPYTNASSAWEDPSSGASISQLKPWSPFESKRYLNYEINNIIENINTLKAICLEYSYFSLIILLSYFILLISPLKNMSKRTKILYPLLTFLIFPLGYLLIVLDIRYFWILFILLAIMGFYLLQRLFQNYSLNQYAKTILCIILLISFITMPISEGYEWYNGYSTYEDWYKSANQLKEQYHVEGNIASSGNSTNYGVDLIFNFVMGTSYYGYAKNNINDTELINELKKYKIDYYIYWENSGKNTRILSQNFPEITNGTIKGIKVFKIK
jgi:hypothetical protein